MEAQCQRKSVRLDSQEVGLEAAILQRVRNSSLVECPGTDNVARLKPSSEAVDADVGALSAHAAGEHVRGVGMVGERCLLAEKPEREHRWSAGKCECRNE